MIRFGVLLVAAWKKIALSLSLLLAFPLLVADRLYASLVSFWGFWFLFCSLFFVVYQTVCLAIVFGHIHDVAMWELGDGEAVCFRLISLFLSICWLEKLNAESWCICCCIREIS